MHDFLYENNIVIVPFELTYLSHSTIVLFHYIWNTGIIMNFTIFNDFCKYWMNLKILSKKNKNTRNSLFKRWKYYQWINIYLIKSHFKKIKLGDVFV